MNKSRRLEIFEKVRQKHAGFLTVVLWKLTADRELFCEAMQIAQLKMWQNVEKLECNKKASAYIYRIALSANSQAWRDRTGRDGHISIGDFEGDIAPKQPEQDKELIEAIRFAIAKLSYKQSRCLVMRYLEQRNYGEIAEKLNCSEPSARSNVSKAIANLRKKLAYLSEQEL